MRNLCRFFVMPLFGCILPALVKAQSLTADFNSTPSTACASTSGCNSFTWNVSGTTFVFTFNSSDAGGSMQWLSANGGVGGSGSMDILSGTDPDFNTTEKVVITRQDGGNFNFTSIYIQNNLAQTATVQAYKNLSPVGAPQSVAKGVTSTLDFGGINVDKVEISSTDFYVLSFDNFTACVTPSPSFTATTVCLGSPTQFTDASTVIATEATYAWDFTNNGSTDNTTKGNVTTTYPAAGVYTAKLTITQGGCSNNTTQQVTVLEQTSTPMINEALCPGLTSVSGTFNGPDGTAITVYKAGNTQIGTGTVSGGSWTAAVSTLADGDVITAKATEQGKCQSPSSTAVTVSNPNLTTTTTLVSDNNPSFTASPNDGVNFKATVTSNGNPVTVGTVTFKDGAATLFANVPINGSGEASISTNFTTEGTHIIQAIYNNVCPYATSNGSITQTVNNHTAVTGNTFCNDQSALNINDNAVATPYPSHIFVSGTGNQLQKLTVSLKGFTHTLTSDVDVLLVSPQGGKLVLLSKAGNSSASGVNLTFDDAAASQLPQSSALTSGTFRPTAYPPAASFPAPAPAGSTYAAPTGVGTLANVFGGTDPNGTWSLYVVDHLTGNTGIISGWCLNITTCAVIPPSNVVQDNDPGQCGAVVDYPAASTSGSCGTLSYSQNSHTFFPVGTTTVTINSTAGQTASFTVTVQDKENPQITSCPGGQTVNTATDGCQSAPLSFAAIATDNCQQGLTLKYYLNYGAGNQAEITSPHAFDKGTTTVTVEAKDAAGNTTTCTFNVTVNDTQNPTVIAPDDVTVYTGPGATTCSKVISVAEFGVASHSDNCPGETVQISGVPQGNVFPVGTTVLTYTVTDASGRQATDQQNIIVVDNTAPVLNCPGNVTVYTGPGRTTCNQVASWTVPTPTDNCGIQSLTSNYNPGALFPVGTTTVTYTATDVNSNQSQCSFTVTVIDNTAPVLSCPANVTVYTGAGRTTCDQVASWTVPTPTDNCGIQSLTSNYNPGALFPVGTTTVTYTATDVNSNQSQCSFTVTVIDNTMPVITGCPQNIMTTLVSGCSKSVSWTAPSRSDNCGIQSFTSNYSPGAVFPVGATTVTYTATDVNGNTETCSFTVTVTDELPPTFSTNLSANPVVLWPPDHKLKDIVLTYATGDNCGTVTNNITVTSTDPISGVSDGDKFPDWIVIDDHHVQLRAERGNGKDARIYTITVTPMDASGNQGSPQSVNVYIAHNITAPTTGTPFLVGSTVNFAGVFWDKPGNKHTANWLLDGSTTIKGTVTEPSGNRNGKVTGSYKFTSTGIYKLQMNITDQNKVTSYCNTNEDQEAIVVVYDPNGGYTYGGGWFSSPAGALKSDPTATGKGNFGFTVNYYKNATLPKGETQFEFKVGSFEYNALNFDYLSVAGYKAVFAGSGKIIGGQSGINFTLYVIDGALDGTGVDKIRLKIYNKNTGQVYYNSEPGKSDAANPTTPVGLNSMIVIGGGATAPVTMAAPTVLDKPTELEKLQLQVYPNPSTHQFTLRLSGGSKQEVSLRMVDVLGRVVEARKGLSANSTLQVGATYRPGIYTVEAVQGSQRVILKLVKQPN